MNEVEGRSELRDGTMMPATFAGCVSVDVSGLGLIVYSPSGVAHIPEGEDYLDAKFTEPEDVLPHVYSGMIAGFGTGTPGSFEVRLFRGLPPPGRIGGSEFRLRLCLKVSEGEVCVRDIYDLLAWERLCPEGQRVSMPNGNYRLTLLTDFPESGVLGDRQTIDVYFESVSELPVLKFDGVPMLGPLD